MTTDDVTNKKKWDIFISHAAEDKEDVARPLAISLQKAGVRVWLDERELNIGDSLSEKIDEGLSQSRFGVVVLSPAFLAKHWPKKELSGLRAKEEDGQKVILPIWHNVDKRIVAQFSPVLGDVLAVNTKQGMPTIVKNLLKVIFARTSDSPSAENPSVARRLIDILESESDKMRLVDFLSFHLPQTSIYHDWGGRLIFSKYDLYGTQFDAHAVYAGHGCWFTLFSFTNAWNDPFKQDQHPETNPAICNDIVDTISAIRFVKNRFDKDEEAKRRVRDYVLPLCGRTYETDYLEASSPVLSFYVFAGRRSSIDSSIVRHRAWSKLLYENSDIHIKSYDHIVDVLSNIKKDRL